MGNRNDGGILAAFLLGGLVGAIGALLLAPSSGEETRDKLKGWAEDTWDENKENLEDLKEEIERKIAKKKKAVSKKLAQIKEDIAEAVLDEDK